MNKYNYYGILLTTIFLYSCGGSGTSNKITGITDIETPASNKNSNLKQIKLLRSGASYENARHRLPPVIYSLDIPEFINSNQSYNFDWTVMGYHDTYDIKIVIYNSQGKKIANETLSPYKSTKGQYSWGSISSKRYFYKTSLAVSFSGSQELVVRFFASPKNDTIDNTFLSCLIPGGLGYEPGDSTGRKMKILGI